MAPDIQRPLARAVHGNLPAAGVGAVVRAGAGNDADGRILIVESEFRHGIGS